MLTIQDLYIFNDKVELRSCGRHWLWCILTSLQHGLKLGEPSLKDWYYLSQVQIKARENFCDEDG